jgi:hypothetical protein
MAGERARKGRNRLISTQGKRRNCEAEEIETPAGQF